MCAEDSDEEGPELLQYKVILLGDGAVGKTSICNRFTQDHFAKQYEPGFTWCGLELRWLHRVIAGRRVQGYSQS